MIFYLFIIIFINTNKIIYYIYENIYGIPYIYIYIFIVYEEKTLKSTKTNSVPIMFLMKKN